MVPFTHHSQDPSSRTGITHEAIRQLLEAENTSKLIERLATHVSVGDWLVLPQAEAPDTQPAQPTEIDEASGTGLVESGLKGEWVTRLLDATNRDISTLTGRDDVAAEMEAPSDDFLQRILGQLRGRKDSGKYSESVHRVEFLNHRLSEFPGAITRLPLTLLRIAFSASKAHQSGLLSAEEQALTLDEQEGLVLERTREYMITMYKHVVRGGFAPLPNQPRKNATLAEQTAWAAFNVLRPLCTPVADNQFIEDQDYRTIIIPRVSLKLQKDATKDPAMAELLASGNELPLLNAVSQKLEVVLRELDTLGLFNFPSRKARHRPDLGRSAIDIARSVESDDPVRADQAVTRMEGANARIAARRTARVLMALRHSEAADFTESTTLNVDSLFNILRSWRLMREMPSTVHELSPELTDWMEAAEQLEWTVLPPDLLTQVIESGEVQDDRGQQHKIDPGRLRMMRGMQEEFGGQIYRGKLKNPGSNKSVQEKLMETYFVLVLERDGKTLVFADSGKVNQAAIAVRDDLLEGYAVQGGWQRLFGRGRVYAQLNGAIRLVHPATAEAHNNPSVRERFKAKVLELWDFDSVKYLERWAESIRYLGGSALRGGRAGT